VTTSTITDILVQNMVYVDKTSHLSPLLFPKRKYFLSRPRKWGKSTLLSTIEAILRGGEESRHLFKVPRVGCSFCAVLSHSRSRS
jgi:hypothetical protein